MSGTSTKIRKYKIIPVPGVDGLYDIRPIDPEPYDFFAPSPIVDDVPMCTFEMENPANLNSKQETQS